MTRQDAALIFGCTTRLPRPVSTTPRSLATMGVGTEITTPNIDFTKVAQGLGVAAEGPIEDPAKLAAAIHRGIQAVKRGEPYLIDAITGSR